MARFLVFITPDSYPDHQRPALIDPPAALVEALQAIAAGVQDGTGGNLSGEMIAGVKPEPYTVPMTDEAETAYEAMGQWQLERLRAAAGTYVTSIVGRLRQNATKLALLRAISRNPGAPTIAVGDIEWGRALAVHCMDTLMREADDNVADTPYARNVQAAQRIIRKHGPITVSDMFRKGWKIPERDRMEILRTLVESHIVTETRKEGGTGKGRPSVQYSIKV